MIHEHACVMRTRLFRYGEADYNFCRKHRSLGGKTTAMAAGLTDYVWTASDLLALDIWASEASAACNGSGDVHVSDGRNKPYKTRAE